MRLEKHHFQLKQRELMFAQWCRTKDSTRGREAENLPRSNAPTTPTNNNNNNNEVQKEHLRVTVGSYLEKSGNDLQAELQQIKVKL